MKKICHIVHNISGKEKECFVFVTLSWIISFSFSVKMVKSRCEFGYSSPVRVTSFLLGIKNRVSYATAMCVWAVAIKLSLAQLCLQDLIVCQCFCLTVCPAAFLITAGPLTRFY